MAYMLLCALPKEIVDFIYHINNSEYAFIYFTKFTFKKYEQIKSLLYPEVYNFNQLYQKHIKIKNIYNYLTSILECNYRYSREKMQPLLHDISKQLMFCHNINILDKDNTNYILTKSSIKQWFKLCQKYNLYIFLIFVKDDKIYKKIFNPNKMVGINIFSHFAISPIILLNEVFPDKDICSNSLCNQKMFNDKLPKLYTLYNCLYCTRYF